VVKPLDRIGDRERAVIDERTAAGYGTPALEHFADTAGVLRVLLERLLPGVPANIDLASFVDSHAGKAMGRGDRRQGLPPVPELFAAGLVALAGRGFVNQSEDDQRALIGRMRRGEADDELGVPAKDFVDRLLDKALAGYLAHPDTWIRIGFTGPAYPEGYAWIGGAEAIARHDKKPGWDKL
jgi:hypothetical protein